MTYDPITIAGFTSTIAPQPAAVALTAQLQQLLPEVVDVEVPPGAQLVVDGSPLVDVLNGIEDQVPGLHVAAEVHDLHCLPS